MASFRLAPNARDDLERIWLYGLEHWGVEQADHYIHELYARFEELAKHPLHYPAVDDIREGYRRSVLGTNTIYFRVSNSDVEVMAIIGNQDLETWL